MGDVGDQSMEQVMLIGPKTPSMMKVTRLRLVIWMMVRLPSDMVTSLIVSSHQVVYRQILPNDIEHCEEFDVPSIFRLGDSNCALSCSCG